MVADVTRPDTLGGLPPADTVLYSVGFDRRGPGARRDVYVDGLRHVLDALAPTVGKVIFTSSTGVYGPADGGRVDEDTPCRPTREAGIAMLAGEEALRSHRLGPRGIVLRLAGLYGPGRIPLQRGIGKGTGSVATRDAAPGDEVRATVPVPFCPPLAVPAHGWLNLIHVDDAVEAIIAAEGRAVPPRTYVASDGHPADRRAFYTYLAQLQGLALPEFIDPPPGDPSSDRSLSDKRANNARMLAELGVVLKYPSYREGLAAIVEGPVRFQPRSGDRL